jgi:hypothetical protein
MAFDQKIAAALALLDGIAESKEDCVERAQREGRGGWSPDRLTALDMRAVRGRLRYALARERRRRP